MIQLDCDIDVTALLGLIGIVVFNFNKELVSNYRV